MSQPIKKLPPEMLNLGIKRFIFQDESIVVSAHNFSILDQLSSRGAQLDLADELLTCYKGWQLLHDQAQIPAATSAAIKQAKPHDVHAVSKWLGDCVQRGITPKDAKAMDISTVTDKSIRAKVLNLAPNLEVLRLSLKGIQSLSLEFESCTHLQHLDVIDTELVLQDQNANVLGSLLQQGCTINTDSRDINTTVLLLKCLLYSAQATPQEQEQAQAWLQHNTVSADIMYLLRACQLRNLAKQRLQAAQHNRVLVIKDDAEVSYSS